MLIREMKVEDLPRIIELEHQLFTSVWKEEDFIYEIEENQFSHNFVLEDESYIIGYGGVYIMYENSEITTLGVDSLYQRHGYGKILLEHMISLAKEKECEIMSLEVRISNEKAIGLYKKLGFEQAGIRKNYYEDNHEDAYLMIKRLEGEQ